MTFFSPLDNSPGRDRVCNDSTEPELLKVFPPKVLETHFRNGWRFRSDACTTAFAYDPDFCVQGAVKMDPEGFGPEKDAIVGMIQSAFNCSPVGETIEYLRGIAEQTLKNNLWRAIEADLVASLAAFPAVNQTPAPLQAVCALAEAAQFLATNGNCGKGIIVGPYEWFIQLSTQNVIWNGTYHTDMVGNIVIPLSTDNDTVYAFDSNIDIRISEILIMDERAPSIRSVNDRIVRAEQLFGLAIDPCVVASFNVADCCGCASGGGGGGGGSVAVTNFPANQPTTVTNFPANQTVTVSNFPPTSPEFDTELITLCDDNGPFLRRFTYDESTGLPTTVVTTDLLGAAYAPVGSIHDCAGNDTVPPINTIGVSSHQFDVVSGSPWTPAAIPAGRLVGLSHTVVVDTVTVLDSDGTSIIGIPAGFTQNWNVQDDRETLVPVQSITADTATARTIVTMVVATP